MWSQRDGRWANIRVGNSGKTLAQIGCTVTDVAWSLRNAGTDTDPGRLTERLNSIGGFTNTGLLYWIKVTELYPQFKFGSSGYQYIQGSWKLAWWKSSFTHWVLKIGNTIYEPYYGTESGGYPQGFTLTGAVRSASIKGIQPTPPPSGTKTATVTKTMNVRIQPNTSSQITSVLHKGDTFKYDTVVDGENVQGSNRWVHSLKGHYVHQSGVKL